MEGMPELFIDKEFANRCWKIEADETAALVASLKEHGCRDPIDYWAIEGKPLKECPIVDGHNRYLLCNQLKIPYPIRAMQFKDRDEVLAWICRNQIGRRNATPAQRANLAVSLAYYRGTMHDARLDGDALDQEVKLPQGVMSTQAILDAKAQVQVPLKKNKPFNVAMSVAQDTGVSERTVRRDVAFTRAMDRLATKAPELRDATLSGVIERKDAEVLADAPKPILKGISSRPTAELRTAAKETANVIREKRKLSGRPIISIKELQDLETCASRMVRLKTDALKACGGPSSWAAGHHENLRLALDQVFTALLAWQKAAEEHTK